MTFGYVGWNRWPRQDRNGRRMKSGWCVKTRQGRDSSETGSCAASSLGGVTCTPLGRRRYVSYGIIRVTLAVSRSLPAYTQLRTCHRTATSDAMCQEATSHLLSSIGLLASIKSRWGHGVDDVSLKSGLPTTSVSAITSRSLHVWQREKRKALLPTLATTDLETTHDRRQQSYQGRRQRP